MSFLAQAVKLIPLLFQPSRSGLQQITVRTPTHHKEADATVWSTSASLLCSFLHLLMDVVSLLFKIHVLL